MGKRKKMNKVIIMAISFILSAIFTMTATAAEGDWNFYGSARILTQWTNDKAIGGSDTDEFALNLQNNSRIGALVKVRDGFFGHFEFGSGVNLRLLHGKWNFGAGSFIVGQAYTPLTISYSTQAYGGDRVMIGYGNVWGGREPMLGIHFDKFKIALVELEMDDNYGGNSSAMFPAVEMSYDLNLNSVNAKIAGGYQTYDTEVGGTSYDVTSFVIAAGATFESGGFFLRGNVWMGKNPDGLIGVSTGGSELPQADGSVENDIDGYGYLIVTGAKLNEKLSVEFGYGHVGTELDTDIKTNEVSSYYGQAWITMAPGVFIVPEIGVVDSEEAGESKITYIACKWQINF